MESLRDKLKNLRNIAPSATFVEATLLRIIKSPQHIEKKLKARIWESLGYTLALGLGSALLIMGVSGTSYQGLLARGINDNTLQYEARDLNFNIQLQELAYHDEAQRVARLALRLITENELQHLNPGILESELKNINIPKFNNN